MKKYGNFQVGSKMRKTKIYVTNPIVKPHVPETLFLNEKNLTYMLTKYNNVFFKPNIGEGGINVGLVKKEGTSEFYTIHIDTTEYKNLTLAETLNIITDLDQKRKFIIQRAINLYNYQNKPVDIRMMLQKPYQKWMITGSIARIAAHNKVTTNLHGGGTGMPLSDFIKVVNMPQSQFKKLYSRMGHISFNIMYALTRVYPRLRELGIDFGIDKRLYPWVLEVNTMPGYWRFKHFKDKTMYNRINRNHNVIKNSVENYHPK